MGSVCACVRASPVEAGLSGAEAVTAPQERTNEGKNRLLAFSTDCSAAGIIFWPVFAALCELQREGKRGFTSLRCWLRERLGEGGAQMTGETLYSTPPPLRPCVVCRSAVLLSSGTGLD